MAWRGVRLLQLLAAVLLIGGIRALVLDGHLIVDDSGRLHVNCSKRVLVDGVDVVAQLGALKQNATAAFSDWTTPTAMTSTSTPAATPVAGSSVEDVTVGVDDGGGLHLNGSTVLFNGIDVRAELLLLRAQIELLVPALTSSPPGVMANSPTVQAEMTLDPLGNVILNSSRSGKVSVNGLPLLDELAILQQAVAALAGRTTSIFTSSPAPTTTSLEPVISPNISSCSLSNVPAGVTEIRGDLILSGCSALLASDLLVLVELRNVTGNVRIERNGALVNLNGLASLSVIGGYLHISNNYQLTNINGLAALSSIGKQLYILANVKLTNLHGLQALTRIGAFLTLGMNHVLQDLAGLEQLKHVNEYVRIENHDSLSNLNGFAGLTHIGNYLLIYNNKALQHLDGLGNLKAIQTDLDVKSNDNLTVISGFDKLPQLGSDMSVRPCQNFSIRPFPLLQHNDRLSLLAGFESLTSITSFELRTKLDDANFLARYRTQHNKTLVLADGGKQAQNTKDQQKGS
ncbi:uncharacterized protein MONBRDRAFT_30356 [Monosiga brevicollis MX1]|uniref:Receptor L-domain domain-containing protein n=1 Tax=Monosiga brevicollis TaxID=81824 RepID=A9VDR3_MONBE|nr:uncharacterized protein MONBRDRAFT_30356 [Monosiga brevicollis MX1]EDQ84367.1 predicted protein [Monosiga brevicollis MX1]|eukprot:XP_001750863.1 hypothetical protein [Monosiga brevicollis MX1]